MAGWKIPRTCVSPPIKIKDTGGGIVLNSEADLGDLVITGKDIVGEERRMRDNMQMALREIYLRTTL